MFLNSQKCFGLVAMVSSVCKTFDVPVLSQMELTSIEPTRLGTESKLLLNNWLVCSA